MKSTHTIAQLQSSANAAVDRLRRREDIGEWDPLTHAPEYAPLPGITDLILVRKEPEYRPEGVLYSNEHLEAGPGKRRAKRKSRGALAREVKEERRALRAEKIKAQQTDLDLDSLTPSSTQSLRKQAKRALSSAASRRSGRKARVKARTRDNPWSLVKLTNGEYATLIQEAKIANYVFFDKPPGWHGQWPFGLSPDRRDPSDQRYVKENLRFVPWIENRARGDAYLTIFEAWAKYRGLQNACGGSADEDLAMECKKRWGIDPRQPSML